MHYFIIVLIIVIIVVWQFYSFILNKINLTLFKNIFPKSISAIVLIQNETVLEIHSYHTNKIFQGILSSLNKYLNNNKSGVSDYHLIKDVVDRNCDAKEEEIQSQIPVPLYLGLAGTMFGILIGIGFLVFSGGLNELLNAGKSVGSEGIETLLGGVALAMISSIIGIILTTVGSQLSKDAKIYVEENKNSFLSWIQAELLPNISSDTSSALVKMTQNLSNFNNTFTQNTTRLDEILSNVTESYQKQKELMQYVNRLKITDIVTANIDVYDKLKNCSSEIGTFAQYLQSTNEYLKNVQSLNNKLDDYEKRTQIIENAGKFFLKNETWLAENFDTTNINVQAAIKRFDENTKEHLTKLQESLNGQLLSFDSITRTQQEMLLESLIRTNEIVTESVAKTQQAFLNNLSEQQQAFHNKLNEISKLTDEIKNLTHIKEGIRDFKEATNKQSFKIDDLTKEIRSLAFAKSEGASIKQIFRLPKWINALIITISFLLITSCLFYLVPQNIELFFKLFNELF